MTERSKLLVVQTLSAGLPAVAPALLLAFLGGPSEVAVRCERSGATPECQVRRRRVLGAAGNSGFSIPALSYALAGQAGAASIEIRPDLVTAMFLFGAVPILLAVGAVLGLRRWSGRRKSEPASA